jgi:Ca2+-binding EF-hand superfamily protein
MKFPLSILLAALVGVSFAIAAEGDAPPKPAKPDKPKATPEDVFKKLDKDGDGSLSLEEFKASPAGKKDAAKAEDAFKRKDKNNDQKLSLEEFKARAPKKEKDAPPAKA